MKTLLLSLAITHVVVALIGTKKAYTWAYGRRDGAHLFRKYGAEQ